jgi:hypothetical protein
MEGARGGGVVVLVRYLNYFQNFLVHKYQLCALHDRHLFPDVNFKIRLPPKATTTDGGIKIGGVTPVKILPKPPPGVVSLSAAENSAAGTIVTQTNSLSAAVTVTALGNPIGQPVFITQNSPQVKRLQIVS